MNESCVFFFSKRYTQTKCEYDYLLVKQHDQEPHCYFPFHAYTAINEQKNKSISKTKVDKN